MIYRIKTDIIAMLRHLVEAIQPFARANLVCLSFEPGAEKLEVVYHPEDIVPSLVQLLCRVVTFTPCGYEACLSVELPYAAREKHLLISITNTGFNLEGLKDIVDGLPLPVKVKPLSDKGTRFELSLSIGPEEETGTTFRETKAGANVPVLYQKLRQRMHTYATSVKNLEEAVAREQSQREQVFLKKVNAIILANLGREDFDVRALARSLALSRTQLYRRLQPLIHLPPSRYIRFIRLQKAKEYLEKGEMDVGEACFRVGFVSKSHFTRAFQRQFGFNPSYLRKSHTKQKTPS